MKHTIAFYIAYKNLMLYFFPFQKYERTPEQNEELGLGSGFKVEGYENETTDNAPSDTAQKDDKAQSKDE